MQVFGICVAKNEADILRHTLSAAREWCDQIFCLDNGSTDGTWDLIQQIASQDRCIVAYKQDTRPFNNSIRAQVFNAFRDQAQDGDWWCRLDADEIYVRSPREVLEEAKAFHVVWGLHLQYYFTDKDLERYNVHPDQYCSDLHPADRLRWYVANASEPRFFKYRKRLKWEDGAWPRHMGRVYPVRVLLRHYQYRTPSQIERRLDDRIKAMKHEGEGFSYITSSDWRFYVKQHRELHYDRGDGRFCIDESLIPKHSDPFLIDAVKYLFHTMKVWP